MTIVNFPMRINKYLAMKKIASRREADDLIREGKVMINNQKAKLGEIILETDKIIVEGTLKKLIYLAFHKPAGIVTHSPQKGEKSINDILTFSDKVFPVGRLDKDSRGLIILSNDGRITNQLLNPANYHEKEYEVRVDSPITDLFIKKMASGVKISENCLTKKCEIKKMDVFSFSIILTEGKNRQLRRMCEALGNKVNDINRTRIMNIKLDHLKPARYRIISGEELQDFLLGLNL